MGGGGGQGGGGNSQQVGRNINEHQDTPLEKENIKSVYALELNAKHQTMT